MSNNKHYVGLSASDIEKGQEFLPFSKVCVIVGEDENGTQLCYFAKLTNDVATACTAAEYDTASGRPLETNIDTFYVPQGQAAQQAGQALAVSILNQIKGYVYKPYSAQGAFIDDDAELGDGVTLGGIYSVMASQDITFDSLMTSEIEASGADETDNEFGDYTPKSDREIKRQLNQTITRFNVKTGQIEAEVSGIYAPEFVSGTTYHKGEVVKVTNGDTITYYEYINNTASTVAPPNATYWSVTTAPTSQNIFNIGLNGITLSSTASTTTNNTASITLSNGTVSVTGNVTMGKVKADELTANAINTITLSASKITAGDLNATNIGIKGEFTVKDSTGTYTGGKIGGTADASTSETYIKNGGESAYVKAYGTSAMNLYNAGQLYFKGAPVLVNGTYDPWYGDTAAWYRIQTAWVPTAGQLFFLKV